MYKRTQLKKPKLDVSKEEPFVLFDGVRELGGVLPKSAGFFVGLTAIAYYCGWRESVSYHVALGASWVVPSLPAFSFLLLSADTIAVIALFGYLAIQYIGQVESGAKQIAMAGFAMMMISIFLSLPPALPSGWLTDQSVWGCNKARAICMYIAAGLLLGQASSELHKSGLKWSSKVILTLYTVIFYGLYQTPATLGADRARHYLLPTSHDLPTVVLTNGTEKDTWRFVELLGQHALLINIPTGKPTRFRLVEVKEIASIENPAPQ